MNEILFVITLILVQPVSGSEVKVWYGFTSETTCESFAIFHLEDAIDHYQEDGFRVAQEGFGWCKPTGEENE